MSEIPDIKIRVVTVPEDVSAFWEWLTTRTCGYVAVDTETGSNPAGRELDWWRPGFHIRLVQFGDIGGGWAIPAQGWPFLITAALAWCSRARVRLVFHNLRFDLLAFASDPVMHYEIDTSLCVDTMVLAGLGGYAEESRDLKTRAAVEIGGWTRIGQRVLENGMKNAGWTWTDVPMTWHPYSVYGVVDTYMTAALFEKWREDVWERWRPQHDLEIAAVEMTAAMSRTGLAVDNAYLVATLDECERREKEILAVLAGYGVSGPNSNAAIAAALRRDGALPEWVRLTNTGKISVDADALRVIDHPLSRAVLAGRFVHRVKTTYLGALLEAAGGEADGIGLVHPEIRPMEARTSRMSVANPPMQQMPRDDPIVRKAVIGREPDHVVISADYGQIEMRLWASMNKDHALLDTLNDADERGEDFFVAIGQRLYNEPGFVKADPRRTLIKSTMYATAYAGGIETIAATAGVPVAQAAPVLETLKKAYPSIRDIGQSMVSPGGGGSAVIFTPSGRRFRVRNAKEKRVLPNYAVQGFAAEVLKQAMVRLRGSGLGDRLMLPVHDELLLSVHKDEAVEAEREVVACMDSVIDPARFGVAIRATSGIGANWAEAH